MKQKIILPILFLIFLFLFVFVSAQNCTDSDGGKNYYIKGETYSILSNGSYVNPAKDACFIKESNDSNLVSDECKVEGACVLENYCGEGGIREYKIKVCPKGCQDGACIKEEVPNPVCGNGICEEGEGKVCDVTATACTGGDSCEADEGRCYFRCPQDCKNLPEIYGNFWEKFKLNVGQTIKFEKPLILKIKFNDILIPRECSYKVEEKDYDKEKEVEKARIIEEYNSITGEPIYESSETFVSSSIPEEKPGCISRPETAILQVKFYEGRKQKTEVIKLEVGEKKRIFDSTIYFIDYNKITKTGFFLVNSKEDFECPKNCKCDDKGNKIECWQEIKKCSDEKILCPDGYCKEECEIQEINNTENCDFGCFYQDKCLPYGLRVKGLYCDVSGNMKTQLNSEESCENNFECGSNLCLNKKCISGNLIAKFLRWIKNLFK